jgi:hypothetical protein
MTGRGDGPAGSNLVPEKTLMRQHFVRLLGAASVSAALRIGLFAGLSSPAWAAAIYTYTGNNFTTTQGNYTTSDFVAVTMILNNPIGPNLTSVDVLPGLVSLTATDGVQTLDLPPTVFATVPTTIFTTDAQGDITFWTVDLSTELGPGQPPGPEIRTENQPSLAGDLGKLTTSLNADVPTPLGSNTGVPGKWVLSPEPGTLVLLGIGLVAMTRIGRRNV